MHLYTLLQLYHSKLVNYRHYMVITLTPFIPLRNPSPYPLPSVKEGGLLPFLKGDWRGILDKEKRRGATAPLKQRAYLCSVIYVKETPSLP
jgi:hypothetical protein